MIHHIQEHSPTTPPRSPSPRPVAVTDHRRRRRRRRPRQAPPDGRSQPQANVAVGLPRRGCRRSPRAALSAHRKTRLRRGPVWARFVHPCPVPLDVGSRRRRRHDLDLGAPLEVLAQVTSCDRLFEAGTVDLPVLWSDHDPARRRLGPAARVSGPGASANSCFQRATTRDSASLGALTRDSRWRRWRQWAFRLSSDPGGAVATQRCQPGLGPPRVRSPP
jgi:hypothetical protein